MPRLTKTLRLLLCLSVGGLSMAGRTAAQSDPAGFSTVLNLPGDDVPAQVGSDTQINVGINGILPSSTEAPLVLGSMDGSSRNIELNVLARGDIGKGLIANAGTVVNVFGGSLEGRLFDPTISAKGDSQVSLLQSPNAPCGGLGCVSGPQRTRVDWIELNDQSVLNADDNRVFRVEAKDESTVLSTNGEIPDLIVGDSARASLVNGVVECVTITDGGYVEAVGTLFTHAVDVLGGEMVAVGGIDLAHRSVLVANGGKLDYTLGSAPWINVGEDATLILRGDKATPLDLQPSARVNMERPNLSRPFGPKRTIQILEANAVVATREIYNADVLIDGGFTRLATDDIEASRIQIVDGAVTGSAGLVGSELIIDGGVLGRVPWSGRVGWSGGDFDLDLWEESSLTVTGGLIHSEQHPVRVVNGSASVVGGVFRGYGLSAIQTDVTIGGGVMNSSYATRSVSVSGGLHWGLAAHGSSRVRISGGTILGGTHRWRGFRGSASWERLQAQRRAHQRS